MLCHAHVAAILLLFLAHMIPGDRNLLAADATGLWPFDADEPITFFPARTAGANDRLFPDMEHYHGVVLDHLGI
jgi:hypothetical protein